MRLMRGIKALIQEMFSSISQEPRVIQDHYLRAIRAIVDRSLTDMYRHHITMHSTLGHPSIPAEYLLRALLLQVFHSLRAVRQLDEQLKWLPKNWTRS